jgi:hypothetical protein
MCCYVVLWLGSNARHANNLGRDFQNQISAVESLEERMDLLGCVSRPATNSLSVYIVTLLSLYPHV